MVKVRVPATTANIGSGFDCMGIALNLYNNFYIEEIEEGLIIEGCDEKYKNKDNLIYTSMLECFKKANYKYKGVKITIDAQIPESRGLGSSASCILGGVIGANELMGKPFSNEEILKLATDIEGHPDNISPALLGSAVVSILDDEKVYYNKIKIASELKFCALVPDFTLSTEKSRAILPQTISYKDAIFNIGRVATMVAALNNGDLELINIGCQDKLHERYRGELIEDYFDIVSECKKYSVATFLSGAGPTIMNILRFDDNSFKADINSYLEKLKNKWSVIELNLDLNGAMAE